MAGASWACQQASSDHACPAQVRVFLAEVTIHPTIVGLPFFGNGENVSPGHGA
jgi:hypothetical protein